ncbi:unnamed protein product, partial [Cuscuta epithymum]
MTNSTESSSHSSSSQSSSLQSFPVIFNHPLPIKLDSNNFLLWRHHVQSVIKAHKLLKFIGKPQIPDRFVVGDNGERIVNEAYNVWEQQDQMLFPWLLASLSDSLHARVIHCKQSHQLWNEIQDFFRSNVIARTRQLKSELYNTGKGDRSISDYLLRIQTIIDNLILVGESVTTKDHIDVILEGLPEEYESFVSSVSSRSILDPISVSDLEALLLAKELRLKKLRDSSQQALFSANVARLEQSAQNNGNETHNSSENASVQVSQFDDSGGSSSYRGRGRGNFIGGRGGCSGGRNPITCQVCGKNGHHALICYNRFNPTYTAQNPTPTNPIPSNPISFTQWYLSISNQHQYNPYSKQYHQPQLNYMPIPHQYTPHNHSNPFNNPVTSRYSSNPSAPSNFNWVPSSSSTLNLTPNSNLSNAPTAAWACANSSVLGLAPNSQNWFPDSGATHHVTSDPLNLQHSEPIATTDKLFMGNGQGLEIKSIGFSSFSSPYQSSLSLSLKNILHVP